MPKEVAAANHNADVSVNALAVGLLDGTFSVTSVDNFFSPERDVALLLVIG
jgi:hypothetical protein